MTSLMLHAAAIKLDCTYKRKDWGTLADGDDYCQVNNLNVTTRNVAIDGVLIDHSNGNDNISAFIVESQPCYFIPRGIENVFNDLEVIQFDSTHLKQVSKNDLRPFTGLKALLLEHNDLEVIEKDLFMHNKKLTYISFAYNELKHIDTLLLEPLTELTIAFFSSNQCISMNAYNQERMDELKSQIAQNCQNTELAKKHDAIVVNCNTNSYSTAFLSFILRAFASC